MGNRYGVLIVLMSLWLLTPALGQTTRPVGRAATQPAAATPATRPAQASGAVADEFDEGTLSKAFQAANLAFMRRVTLDAYRQRQGKDPRWAEAGLKFLQLRNDAFAIDDTPAQPEMLRLGQLAVAAGCDDPMVLYWYSDLLRGQERVAEARTYLEQALKGFQAGQYSVDFLCRSARRMLRSFGGRTSEQNKQLTQLMRDSLVQTILRGPYRPDEQRLLLYHFGDPLKDGDDESLAAVCKSLIEAQGADPWTVNLIAANLLTNLAWKARGGGAASTVTEEGWKGFNENLAQARVLLEKAWQLNPRLPEAATGMIAIAMADGDTRGVLTWFNRAVAAELDYGPAYDAARWALRPRWGGSHPLLLEWGRKCASSARYDTLVPFEQFRAAWAIADDLDGDWTTVLSEPGVYDELQKMFDAYVAASPRRAAWALSYKAALAWRMRQWSQARASLDKGGDKITLVGLKKLGGTQASLNEVYGRTGPAAELVKTAWDEYAQGHLDKCLQKFQEALAKLPASDKSFPYIKSRVWDLQKLIEFDKGDWVDISPNAELLGWNAYGGHWRLDSAKGLLCETDVDPEALMSELPLGERLEVRVEMSVVATKGMASPNLGILYGKGGAWTYGVLVSPPGSMVMAQVVGPRSLINHIGTSSKQMKSNVTMHLLLWDGNFGLNVDGASVFQGRPMRNWVASSDWHIGLGGTFRKPGATLGYQKILVRKLREYPFTEQADSAPSIKLVVPKQQ